MLTSMRTALAMLVCLVGGTARAGEPAPRTPDAAEVVAPGPAPAPAAEVTRNTLPPRLMAGIARALAGPMTTFFPGVPQQLTPGAVLVLSMQRRADISKARTELGYEPGALEPTVRAWYEFFAAAGMIK